MKDSIAKELIIGCINNSRSAQKELYVICFRSLISVCMRYTNSDLDARSLFNLGFLKICQNLDKYRPEVPFHTWAKRVMINVIIDDHRRNKKYKENISIEYDISNASYPGNRTENDFLESMNGESALNMLKALPEMTRNVFNLYVFEGYNHREISDLLAISENTSKWHLHNGKMKLRAIIEKNNGLQLTKIAI